MSKVQTVTAVRLRYNPKPFWFDPVFSTYKTGDHVLVDTERGREVGLVVDGALEVTEKQIKDLKTPLKPVIRVVTEADFDLIDELDAKGKAAMPIFRELIEKHQLDMKPVSVEFLFTGDKAVFYFSNDERVDFRDLVRDLASHFRIRVDMRQIGVRDEARILGGLAHCGEELCCARLGGEFQPVSIRIAKEQDLPLNPSKISGACGRLMCCLRYEFEAYRDFKNRAPKRGALIETPIGQAKVIDFDTPREVIIMRLEDGKQLSIPLCEFQCKVDEDGRKHPCSVSKDTINRCTSSGIMMALASLEQEFSQGTGSEKVDPGLVDGNRDSNRTTRRPRRPSRQTLEDSIGETEKGPTGSKPVRGAQASRSTQATQPAKATQSAQTARPSSSQPTQPSYQRQQSKPDGGQKDNNEDKSGVGESRRNAIVAKGKPRPGQHSSALRNNEQSGSQDKKHVGRFRKKTFNLTEQSQEQRNVKGEGTGKPDERRVDKNADKRADKNTDRRDKAIDKRSDRQANKATDKRNDRRPEKSFENRSDKDTGGDVEKRPSESFRRRWRRSDTKPKP